MKIFDKRLAKSLIENGYLVPTSSEEVKLYLSKNKIDEIPNEFEISLNNDSHQKEYHHNSLHSDYNETEINLAQAAREGREIPEEIKKMMDNDRKNSNSKK